MSVVALSSVRQDLILLSDRRLMLQDLQMFLICSSMLNPLSSTAPILRTDELPEITESPMVILMSDVIFLSCAGWPMTISSVFPSFNLRQFWDNHCRICAIHRSIFAWAAGKSFGLRIGINTYTTVASPSASL